MLLWYKCSSSYRGCNSEHFAGLAAQSLQKDNNETFLNLHWNYDNPLIYSIIQRPYCSWLGLHNRVPALNVRPNKLPVVHK